MQGRTNSDDLVMVALYAYSPAHGCSVYWTGSGWHPNGKEAALFAAEHYAEKATKVIELPDGSPEFRYEHRNMI